MSWWRLNIKRKSHKSHAFSLFGLRSFFIVVQKKKDRKKKCSATLFNRAPTKKRPTSKTFDLYLTADTVALHDASFHHSLKSNTKNAFIFGSNFEFVYLPIVFWSGSRTQYITYSRIGPYIQFILRLNVLPAASNSWGPFFVLVSRNGICHTKMYRRLRSTPTANLSTKGVIYLIQQKNKERSRSRKLMTKNRILKSAFLGWRKL